MGREQKKYHYIYKTTCNINGKYYIGMHSTDNLKDGYLGSGKRLWNSINYHGKENFTKEILEFCENREQLKKRETEIVNEQLINEKLCMNLKVGGVGGFVDEEHMLKFTKAGTESIKHKMKTNLEFREKVSKRMSLINKMGHAKGVRFIPDWNGKRHTEETKKKMSETMKGRYCGEKNPQYGTCWITKDGENKKIKRDQLSNYEKNGWVRGRKI